MPAAAEFVAAREVATAADKVKVQLGSHTLSRRPGRLSLVVVSFIIASARHLGISGANVALLLTIAQVKPRLAIAEEQV